MGQNTTRYKRPPTVFSFFSGIGLLDLAFENAGFCIASVNEYHEPFLDGYKCAREKMGVAEPEYGYHLGSIANFLRGSAKKDLLSNMRKAKMNHLVMFVAGPPCPDFSIGGKNRGHVGDNGRLTGTYFDLIIDAKPDMFLFENVKGLWRTRRHRAFYDSMKAMVSDAGYCLTDKLINCIEYGAPQDRDRIILIGMKKSIARDILGSASHDTLEKNFAWDSHAVYPDGKAFTYSWPDTTPFRIDGELACPNGLPKTLTVQYWFDQNHVTEHPNSKHVFKPRAGLARFKSVEEGDTSKKSFKRLHRWRWSPTACYGNNEVHLHPYKARRITVAEALAIQSMPKEYELPSTMSLSNMFKAVGNGVPYVAAKGVALSLLDMIEGRIQCH